jgi:hypothetical protein
MPDPNVNLHCISGRGALRRQLNVNKNESAKRISECEIPKGTGAKAIYYFSSLKPHPSLHINPSLSFPFLPFLPSSFGLICPLSFYFPAMVRLLVQNLTCNIILTKLPDALNCRTLLRVRPRVHVKAGGNSLLPTERDYLHFAHTT